MSCGSLEQKRQYTWLSRQKRRSRANRCRRVKRRQTLSAGVTRVTRHPFPAHLKKKHKCFRKSHAKLTKSQKVGVHFAVVYTSTTRVHQLNSSKPCLSPLQNTLWLEAERMTMVPKASPHTCSKTPIPTGHGRSSCLREAWFENTCINKVRKWTGKSQK